jgi:hypothetical protein
MNCGSRRDRFPFQIAQVILPWADVGPIVDAPKMYVDEYLLSYVVDAV